MITLGVPATLWNYFYSLKYISFKDSKNMYLEITHSTEWTVTQLYPMIFKIAQEIKAD